MKSHSKGGILFSRASHFQYYNTDQISMEDTLVPRDPNVELSNSLTPRSNSLDVSPEKWAHVPMQAKVPSAPVVLKSSSFSSTPVAPDFLNTTPPITRSWSPPPIIHCSISNPSNLDSFFSKNLHSMAIDQVISALDGGNSEGSGQEDDDLDDSTDAMIDDEGLDDSMTHVQYQEEVLQRNLG